MLPKISVVITTLRRSIAPGQMEQQKGLFEESKKEQHLSWYNLVSQRDGGTMRWSVVATCATYMFPLQTDTQLMKKDCNALFSGPITPFGTEITCKTIFQEDTHRLHQVGKKMLPGLFMGCALRTEVNGRVTRRSRTGRTLRLIQLQRWESSQFSENTFSYALMEPQPGHVAPRTLRHRQLQKEAAEAEGNLEAGSEIPPTTPACCRTRSR